MSKIYTLFYGGGFDNNNPPVFSTNNNGVNKKELKKMVKSELNKSLGKSIDKTVEKSVDKAIDKAVNDMDIKLEGENLDYKLMVNGNENGEINIPKDQFLKTIAYDSDAKKLIFTIETTEGEKVTEVSISELVAPVEEEIAAVDAKVDAIEIPDVSNFATKDEIPDVSNFATKDELPDVSNFATKDELPDVSNFATKSEIPDVSNFATKDELPDVSNFATKDEIPSIDDLATKDELNAVDAKIPSIDNLATKAEVEAVDAKVDAIEIPDVSNFATKDEIPSIDDLATKTEVEAVDAKIDAIEIPDVSDLATKAEVEAVDAKVDAIEIPSIDNLATKAEVEAVDAKVDAIVIPDVTDLATKAEVEAVDAKIPSIDHLATKAEVEAVDAKVDSLAADLAVALPLKADAADVYTKAEADDTFQASGDYVAVEDYNELLRKFAALENYVNIFINDREEKMDEIINNMGADNKEVTIETPMQSIDVPETTVAYTITAPLKDNSTVTLASPKYMYLNNTSEEPVSTTISHEYAEGETTSATAVYLTGNFDTLTLENVNPSVASGKEAATAKNVVITENNVKNLTLNLNLEDGATITNNSNTNITIQDKNNEDTELTIVAPNSTVSLNNGHYTTLTATVSDNTLIIKKTAHIENLAMEKGNAQVEVSREADIANVVENYTLAEGCSITYLHDEIDNATVSNLSKAGEHTLIEDVSRTGNFSTGVFSTDDIVWNLNGHNIEFDNTRDIGGFSLRNAAKLEINGNGDFTVLDKNYGIWAAGNDVRVVINGGNYQAGTHVLYAEKGIIEVNAGTFRLNNEDTADRGADGNFKFLLNCLDASYRSGIANIIVRGGKFYDFNPGNCEAEGAGTSFLAEGYVAVESTEVIDGVEHKVYTVQAEN